MNLKALAVATLLVLASVGGTMAVSADTADATQSAEAYSGTHVSFETTSDAVTGYTVNDETVVSSVQVQSAEQARANGDLSADLGLSAVTGIVGAAVDVQATASTNATVTTESGAELKAHDNDRGILVVRTGGSSQVVHANVSSNSEASAEGENRVVVQQDDGSSGTFIVVGEGNVTVDDSGNVTAMLEEDSKLVYRQYEGERSDDERQQEELIANGTAAAEVYVQSAAEAGGDAEESGEDASDDARNRTADVVKYSEDTSVEVTERTESGVNMTVERAESEGRVVITSVSEAVVSNAEDVSVTVDGEAAAQAESYGEVQQATQDGESSKYLVRQSSSAEASYDVVVGINHFSERNVAVQDGSGSSGDSDQSTPDGSSGDGAGFGVGIALVSLVGAALLARYRA